MCCEVGVAVLLEKRHVVFFFFSSRRRHTIFDCDWSSDVCSSDLHSSRRASESRVCTACTHTPATAGANQRGLRIDRKSTRLNSSHSQISYAVFCLKKKKKKVAELKRVPDPRLPPPPTLQSLPILT